MRFTRCLLVLPGLVLAAASCTSSLDPTFGESSALSCDEYTSRGEIDARVDANVKAYMEASTDVKNVSLDLRAKVKTACASIALDLGGKDTWTALGDVDAAVSNKDGTGACNVAASRIEAIMSAHAEANFALSITRGQCHRDFSMQASCEDQCKADPVCDPGTCETRCEPGALSVKCEGNCKANAQCEGTVDVAANCMGKCEAECQGECKGTCTYPDGHKTDNDPNCHGKCSASCNGKCKGLCKVDAAAGVQCGANVRCTGGCEGSYTEPTCTTSFKPGPCHTDQGCLDSCVSKAEAHQVCEPTRVELYADVKVHADVQKLVDTCNKNLPTLFAAAEVDGKLVVEAAERLVATGNAVVEGHASLNSKSAACAGAATKVDAHTADTVHATADGTQQVTSTCQNHSN